MPRFSRAVVAAVATVTLALGPLTLAVAPAHAAAVTLAPLVTKDLASPGMTAAALATDLMGTGVTGITNVSYQGAYAQAGTIDIADPAVVSFNHGVILSSGNIADIAGPNKSESTTGDMASWPGVNSGASDADLTNLIANTATVNPMTYDAASLQFDFTPNASDIYFTYVFGSDEYLEWVNLYNDVFAFWVNDNAGNKTNCAVTKDGLPVSIDTVNSAVDTAEYRDNSFWNPPANPINIESDGLTVEMICHAKVTPNKVNHIKLAIADTSDQILDSQVMIKASSLSTVPPESCNNGVDDNGNSAVDMNDDYCKTTTTPAPPGTGVPTPPTGGGSWTPPVYSGTPFTGTEGTPVWLDANSLGWNLAGNPVATSWQVYVNGNTALQCDVYNADGSLQTRSPLNPDGSYATPYAICPSDGKYTARIDGWDSMSGGGSTDDHDVDFTIANAPPSLDVASLGQFTDVVLGDSLTVDAYSYDAPNDTITCSFKHGDGTTSTVVPDGSGYCTDTHTYTHAGQYVLQVLATDNQKDSTAWMSVVTVTNPNGTAPQSITVGNPAPASAAYGNSFTVAATADSGLLVDVTTTGACTNSGTAVTMTASTGSCTVNFDQSGDGVNWDAAQTVSETVVATTRPITVTANAQTVNYGSVDPALTYAVTSGTLVSGDSLSGALTRASGTMPGTYAIGKGTLANSRYSITYVGANLTIKEVVPTISTNPSNASAAIGASVTMASAATGSYTYTVRWQSAANGSTTWANETRSGSTSANYTFSVVAGDSGRQFRAVFTNSAGSATTASATVTIPALPIISAISPTSGGVGTSVTITGTNMAGATGVNFFGGITAKFTVVSPTSIVTSVPSGATAAGAISVMTPAGTATSAKFTPSATLVVPTVTAYGSTSTRAGVSNTFNITGTNLAGATTVALNGVSLTFKVNSATSLSVTVPATGVSTGAIKVTTAGGTSVNTNVFSVLVAPAQLVAGTSHSCAVLTDGTAKCWGLNTNGQLGNGTTTQSTTPVAVSGLSNVKQIAAGANTTCAVLNDGTVKCWGLNTNGQLGNGTTTQSTTPVAVTGIANASQVAVGAAFACAALTDGTVKCWGLNSSGQLGNGTTVQSTTPVAVSGLSGVTAVSLGATNACALLTSGSVKCWGSNANGQLGNGSTATSSTTAVQVSGIDGTTAKATAIDAGDNFVCAVNSGGALKCWGLNTNGQLGDGTTTKRTTPVSVLASAGVSLSGVTAVTAGAGHACAVVAGAIKCWGLNSNGQLGNGSTTQALYPVTTVATLLSGVTQVVAGGNQTLTLVPSVAWAPSVAVVWGANNNGQLGDATTTGKTSPIGLTTL